MYPVQYAPQPYVAAVTPAFNQHPAQAYQAPPVYRPAPVQQRVAAPPAYQQALEAPVYQQPRAQAPRQNAQNQNRRQGERATFNPIPMSYTELYPSLLQKGLVVPRPMGPPPDRLPPWYNPNAHCPFHEGSPGHDLEGCYALKHRVRELIESKILSFKDMGPNVKNNPLPPHGNLQ
ncbi:proline-rich protein 3-like [Lathyrus oleraceus]|uniref:proline-rich protein 3-like n=1 Tax=Pisum sativum TaxID=3888 RepID=UPI0021D21226|nr:proline-rich protein 3-like [Pisum sativum]